ncbi:hypothetical protein H310_02857 [Aphanomyces invadans]|uniref:GB1/RHD3-type G domain-containing protein n=1 Tax=Aphanomyces invadans TaxID=157072 RepID=A0A024UKF5_9STRA|nr:hypothetical protein H310_02857 [Aphanomyces invadans]ETW06675.1 hypothetical protein H310_02857 [Aphanomyces invadans]|eukprot:XP_008864750.1 hypothetical protein H310_02857 [Aphanomyces invadans]
MPPVCLIRQGDDALETCPDGIALLQSLKHEPVAVICLAGQYRTGKSFFLNQMCRSKDLAVVQSNDGFVVGPTTESCTRGIWIWDADQRNARGEKVLLMDTEGIASTDNDETYDAKIFSLGLLLSSVFVFNTMGVIDEGAIDRLFLVSELTKHVCVHQHGTADDEKLSLSNAIDDEQLASANEASLAPHFPPFVWLLRDFLLDIQENGETLTPNVYLERSLQRREGTSKRNEERNRIRQSLRTLFTQRECVTLIRPATDEDKLRNASELTDDELRPEFVVQMRVIRERLLEIAHPKRVLNQVIDGTKLAHIVQNYVATMNNGAVPDIKAAWDYVSDVTCEAAYFHSLDEYKAIMATNTSMAQQEFERVYKEAQDAALNVFKKESVEGEARKRCFQNLKIAIAQDRTQQINALQVKSTEFCTEVVSRLAHEYIKQPIERGDWDGSKGTIDLCHRLSPFFAAYDLEGDGPSKTKVLVQFAKVDMLTILELLFSRMTHLHDTLLESTKMAADDMIREGESVRRAQEQELHQLQVQVARLQGVVSTLEEKLDNANESVTALKQTNQHAQEQLESAEAKRAALRSELDLVKDQHAVLALDNVKLTSQLDHANQATEQAIADRNAIQHNLTADLNEERAERKKERETAISNLAKQAAELHAVQRAFKACSAELEEANRATVLVSKERDLLSAKIKSLLEVHEDTIDQLNEMKISHDAFADEKERLTLRCERLEQQLGDIGVCNQVENVLNGLCLEIAKQFESDKAIGIVIEEKAALQERLGELHEKISTLPDFYQRQVFCAEEPVPDFFEALTKFIGQ